jgi:hypothetical protein
MASTQSGVGERLATNVVTAPGSIASDASPLLPAPSPCLFGGCLLLLWHLGEHACSPNDERCAPRIEMRDTRRIVYWHVQDRSRKGRVGDVLGGQHAEVAPGRWIRLFGSYQRAAFETVFAIGDEAAHSGYNLTYTGAITAIGNRTVSIRDGATRRLGLYEFLIWNRDFDAVRVRGRNRIIGEMI